MFLNKFFVLEGASHRSAPTQIIGEKYFWLCGSAGVFLAVWECFWLCGVAGVFLAVWVCRCVLAVWEWGHRESVLRNEHII